MILYIFLILYKIPPQNHVAIVISCFTSPFRSTFLLGQLLAFYLFMFLAGVSYSISNDMHVRLALEDLRALERERREPKTRTLKTRDPSTRAKKSSESSCWESSRFDIFHSDGLAWLRLGLRLGSSWPWPGYCFPFHTSPEELIRKSINFHGT